MFGSFEYYIILLRKKDCDNMLLIVKTESNATLNAVSIITWILFPGKEASVKKSSCVEIENETYRLFTIKWL